MDGDPHDSKGFIDVWLNNSITTNYTITSLHKYWLYKVGVAGRTFVGHGTYTQVSLRTHGDGKKLTSLGGVYMIPARLSFRYEFTPVPSCGSVFVYMISAQNLIPERVTPVRLHPDNCTGA